ncbi:MAG: ankyrin repeat domain-containing protein, partial [Gemmatimonadetes bacterium]|nr:ankyrin repeat domain-containing protein [Gemmatimonadota bacterium]
MTIRKPASQTTYLVNRVRASPKATGALHLVPLRRCLLPLAVVLGGALSACSPAQPTGDIHEAAKSGDVTRVTSLLTADSDLMGSRDGDGRTPLHHSVRGGHLVVTELLLEGGADVGARDAEERTPLHDAADAGDPDAARILLAHGSDVMAREFRGRTPLYLACNWGDNLEVVRILVEAGADVNDRTPTRGEEILFSTLFYGPQEIIDYLLDSGARLPDDERSIVRAVYISASNGRERVFGMAVDLAEDRGLDWWEDVSMHAAARGGSVSIASALLAMGGEPDGKNVYGVTPLHIAAEHGRLDFVDFLLDRGAQIEEPTRSGLTALHFAAENG